MSLSEEDVVVSAAEEEAEESEAIEGVEGEDAEGTEGKTEAHEGRPSRPGSVGVYNSMEVNDQIFEELVLGPGIAEEVQDVWHAFISSAESREAAGEAIYAALFDAAPSLQSLFKTPRAVMAMRFVSGWSQIVNALHDPTGLKVVVETLGFQHLDLAVTIPRVIVFRDAIVDMLAEEMGARMTPRARDGFLTFLNYVGGAFIYVRVEFSERLRILQSSWAAAYKKGENDLVEELEGEGDDGPANESMTSSGAAEEARKQQRKAEEDMFNSKKKNRQSGWFGSKSISAGSSGGKGGSGDETRDSMNNAVPKNFDDMFLFNAAVMGFSSRTWMNEVLASFPTIVANVANVYRLQEECDVLGLRMAKHSGTVNLSEYKSVMLASLRSLCKDWGSQHEVAWSWLWENVERTITNLMGKPAVQEKALSGLFARFTDHEYGVFRRELYTKFFALAPAGQDFFKQSTTRLHFVADKLIGMSLDMYKEPKRMVEDISAVGLRHVGYGIPTDLIGPFVTAIVQVIRTLTDDDCAEEAFRWSFSLISRIMNRVINEGATIVMKAININSGNGLKRAVACAPRGKRALWMLNVQVGTQSISPLMWAIESGSLDAATAIIEDLLTIRADRDRYYFGMDILFERHPDIIRRLCLDAPALVPGLLDGLVWRSRTSDKGMRRVNYYVKHLLVDGQGNFSKATEWIVANADPKLVCHPVVSLTTDIVWDRVAFRSFLYGRTWFFITLLVFVSSQSLLNKLKVDEAADDILRVIIFGLRCFIYVLSMGRWVIFQVDHSIHDCRTGALVKFGGINVPEYLTKWQGCSSMVLTILLLVMMCLEPILHCMEDNAGKLFTAHCDAGKKVLFAYSSVSTCAMVLYFMLLTDLSVFSTRVSAFFLVCARVIGEVLLFLFGSAFFVACFACAASGLEHDDPDFDNIPQSALNLCKITLGMFSGQHFDLMAEQPALMLVVIFYTVTTVVFLLNLLIAQLSCAYQATYQDMVGFARLNRGKIVYETMPSVAKWRWERFVDSLRLGECCEFGEGDIGLAGGIPMTEPASANITNIDMIRRFGGSTSPAAVWPEEERGDDENDRFDRMERMMDKAVKRMSKCGGKRGGNGSSSKGSAMESGNSVSGTSSGHGSSAGSD